MSNDQKKQEFYIKEFVIDLLNEITIILEKSGERASRKFENIKSHFNVLVERLQNKWKDTLPLEVVDHSYFGRNFVFKGATSSYLVPVWFWTGRNPLKINLNTLHKWLEDFSSLISWEEFQIQLQEVILNEQIPNLGITRRHLEIIRFYARMILEYPHFVHKVDNELRKSMFNRYRPLYDQDITYSLLVKNYNTIIEQYSNFSFLPLPDKWGLDCVLVDSKSINEGTETQISSLPIWIFKGRDNGNNLINLALHRVNQHSITKKNLLFNGLVKKVTFFWNFNNFIVSGDKKSKNRCKLHLGSPWKFYSNFENQKFILFDSFTFESNSSNNTLENYAFAPDWEIHLEFPSSIVINDDKYTKKPINTELLQSYNIRYIDKNHNFFNQLRHEPQNHLINSLFKRRIYFFKFPATIRGVLWLPFRKQFNQTLLEKIKLFLTSWLHQGSLFEYNSGLLIITYFPQNFYSESAIKEIKEFFDAFDLDSYIFLKDSIDTITPLSIYFLPESIYFDVKFQKWNLPEQNLFPLAKEKIERINNIGINELNYLKERK